MAKKTENQAPKAEEAATDVVETSQTATAPETVAATEPDRSTINDPFTENLGKLVRQWLEKQKAIGKKTLADKLEILQLRHETGLLIVAEFGAEPQPRGDAVLTQAANDFKVPLSDLYRCRAFAVKYPNFEAFRREHPEATAWSHVKKLLPTLETNGNKATAPAVAKRAMFKAMEKVTSLLRDIPAEQFMLGEIKNLQDSAATIAAAVNTMQAAAATVAPKATT